MWTRCNNRNHKSYKTHGARGVQCQFSCFEEFLVAVEELGPRPSLKHTIDRKDSAGHYQYGALRWLDKKGQTKNTRSRRTKQQILDDDRARTEQAAAEEQTRNTFVEA